MMNKYTIDYINENEYMKKQQAIKRYNMMTYKKLLFDYYPDLRVGNFLGKLVSSNKKDNIDKYELPLPIDKKFIKKHGEIIVHYSVYKDQKKVVLETITPEDVLTEGKRRKPTTYKRVIVSKSHKELDMFKIILLNSINKK